MTSLMTSQSDDKLGLLYSCLNEIGTFFAITLKRFKVWSSNFMCRCAVAVWPRLQKILLVASLMTSPCLKMGQNWVNRRNFVNIWARKPIISAEHKACPWLAWLYLRIPVPLPGKKFAPHPKWQPFLKFRSSQDSPNLNTYLETTRRDGKNDVSFMKLSQTLTEQRRCEVILICSHIRHWCSKPTFWTIACHQVAISRKRMINQNLSRNGAWHGNLRCRCWKSKVKNQGHGVCLCDRFLNGCISVNF